ncbi:MAG: hypothetical protein A2831_02780 [Candidatus Yanofskybacteria bacterium RIFCSPHIGHO2_01_FULL_44_17]|uniref:Proteasome subunit alpha n=1 Tax=Candidatus Yanofskybacteria bacterium RIFCSPHIGHO2_01_FULL_44_17 TaxID=1802668 RepID=A0A1F8EVC3_9BACT|nr:MAG: hypothetical protein A2831_02780 [Candidatus Yanofskybacteria bacterium RIFCSPHIGHO2_01_FULL_44_17]
MISRDMFNLKEALTKEGLSKSVGLVIRGKDCVVIMAKAKHTTSFHELPEKHSNIFVWAVGGSELDARSYRAEYMRFVSRFSNTFSGRDLNVAVIHDFTANYLRHKLYDIKSAEPASLELIVGSVDRGSMIFYTINYAGKAEVVDDMVSNIAAIGSHDDNRKELLGNLVKLKTSRLTGTEIIKKVTPHMSSFSGNMAALIFTITGSGPAKSNKNSKKNKPRRKQAPFCFLRKFYVTICL